MKKKCLGAYHCQGRFYQIRIAGVPCSDRMGDFSSFHSISIYKVVALLSAVGKLVSQLDQPLQSFNFVGIATIPRPGPMTDSGRDNVLDRTQ